ncbi:MAG: TonB-dependent receptor SusC [Haliscomenobacter sp.]|nr:TonB-dependent receptor SusC [Haliscomenobacter sp.]
MKILATALLNLCAVMVLWGQGTITVTGKVTDKASGEPIIGCNVLLKGDASLGTITDIDGNYSLSVPADGVLAFSYIGYVTLEEPVGGRKKIDAALETDQVALEEVVIIGYGTVKKSNVTGAIVSVKAEDLKTVPTTNVIESLQGKLPGVDITRSSGGAGAGINVLVRGNRSLTASNAPLFIVDGIQYSNIQDLNPNDIESMEVLKDAASTAIYGSRGANGVIIITTKKGRTGKTNVSFNAYTGVSTLAGYPRVMGPEEYKAFRREANRTTGNWTSSADDAKIFGNLLNSPGTYWPDIFLQDGKQSDYQLGITSGTAKTNFYVSMSYFNEEGLLEKDVLNRYNFRANIDHKISDKFQFGTQNQITFYDQDLRFDPLGTANKLVPLEVPYDADGNLIPLINNGRNINPLTDLLENNYENNLRTTRIFSSAYLSVNPLKNLSLKSNLGINLTNTREGLYAGSQTNFRNGAQPLARYIAGNSIGLNLENILNYEFKLQNHSFVLTGVQSLLTNRFESSSAEGANQLIPNQLYYGLANANAQVSIGAAYKESALLSYTGRLLYNYNDKYLLTLTARTDGASQLSEGNKWAFFPSASAAWRVTQENFLSNNPVISDLKIRVSYGVAGNSAVEPYSTQSVLNRVPFAWDEAAAIGYTYSTRIGNPDLRWETSTTANAGVDFGVFDNRIIGTLDIFQTKTSDLLLERLLPLSSGALNTIENVGETENKGIEIGVNAIAVDKTNFRWNIGVNWFRVREKILKLATESNDVANGWFIGQTTESFYDYEKLGIWQSNEADAAKAFNQLPGDIKVKDQNGDGKIDATNDRIIIGSGRPSWIGNFNSDLKFFNFDLNLQVYARWGQMIRYGFTGVYDPQANENSLVHDYWTPENPTNAFPRPNANRSQSATLYYSSLFYQDGSFVKLRGVTLGYSLPNSLISKMHLSKFRVYVSGRNLWTYSKIDDYDPERGGGTSSPMNRLIVGGLNVEF